MVRYTTKPLSQRDCNALCVGSWVIVLWHRMRDHSRPGPYPYRVQGKFNGVCVIAEDTILDNVSLSSALGYDMAWHVEGYYGKDEPPLKRIGRPGPGDSAAGGRGYDGGDRADEPPHDS